MSPTTTETDDTIVLIDNEVKNDNGESETSLPIESQPSNSSKKCTGIFFLKLVISLLIIFWASGHIYHQTHKSSLLNVPLVYYPSESDKPPIPKFKSKCHSATCHDVAEKLTSDMDLKYNPCDDFYKYSCGGWIAKHKVGKDENTTQTFSEVDKVNLRIIRDILVSLKGSESSGAVKKAKDFYLSCINKKKPFDEYDTMDYLPSTTTTKRSEVIDDDYSDYSDEDTKDDEFGWHQLESAFPSIRNYTQGLLEDLDPEKNSLICTILTKTILPEVISRLFVEKTYIPLKKQPYISMMVEEIRKSFKSLISSVSYMDHDTISYILEKFDILPVVLGYPIEIMNTAKIDQKYSSVSISNSSYFTNLIALVKLSLDNKIKDMGISQKVFFTPMANAFYAMWQNELFVPAGLSMKPFFDPDYPYIINFAKFGTTIGHELSHAFETYVKGLSILGIDLPNQEVSPLSLENFKNRGTCIEKQYEGFRIPQKKLSLNGNSTFSEDFADIVGVQVTFLSYMENHKDEFEILPGLEEMTQDQIFFIATAQNQCRSFANAKTEEAILKDEIETAAHSPNFARVMGEMLNSGEFSKAFNCPVGSRYNPVNKCHVFY